MSKSLKIEGTEQLKQWGRPDYILTVSGSASVAGDGDNRGDNASGGTISGKIGGSADKYRFTGEITNMDVPAEATVLVDGQEISTTMASDGSSGSGGSANTTTNTEPEPDIPLGSSEPINMGQNSQAGMFGNIGTVEIGAAVGVLALVIFAATR